MAAVAKIDVTLTDRQRQFVQFLCDGYRPAAAAQRAGFSIASGVHLLRNPAIVATVKMLASNLNYVVQRMDAASAKARRDAA